MFRLSYKILLLVTITATLCGLLSLIPWSNASYPNLTSFKSICTFTPASTFYCFFVAGLSCFIRSTFIKDQSGHPLERLKKHSLRLTPLALLLVCALFFTNRYFEIKSQYEDDITTATIKESV